MSWGHRAGSGVVSASGWPNAVRRRRYWPAGSSGSRPRPQRRGRGRWRSPVTSPAPNRAGLPSTRRRKGLGGIDALVYAPGVGPLVRLADMDAETWRHVFDTNVIGASLVTSAAMPHLVESAGTAVYLSSVSASLTPPWPGLGAYAVSKAALDKLVEAWRGEHPTVGFTRVVVGECMGGDGDSMPEFANGWDQELAAEVDARLVGTELHERCLRRNRGPDHDRRLDLAAGCRRHPVRDRRRPYATRTPERRRSPADEGQALPLPSERQVGRGRRGAVRMRASASRSWGCRPSSISRSADIALERFEDRGRRESSDGSNARRWSTAAGGSDEGGHVILSAPDGTPAPLDELTGFGCFDQERVRIEITDGREGDAARDVTVKEFPTWGDAADLIDVMDVRPDGPLLLCRSARSDGRRPVVEGSQMLGQAIVAATSPRSWPPSRVGKHDLPPLGRRVSAPPLRAGTN